MTPDDQDLQNWLTEISDVTPHKKEASPLQKTEYSNDVEELFTPQPPHSSPLPPKPLHTPHLPTTESISPTQNQRFSPPPPHNSPTILLHSNTADCISGSANGVDAKMLKRLSNGQIPPTDRLDLHGYYETEAWAATQDFLNESYEQENRCVIIIHGKGKGYGERQDMGIIKANMAGWLSNHPRVLAFHTAHTSDGGRGAIYVYLKRRR